MNNKSNIEMILVQTGTENQLEAYLGQRRELLALTYPGPDVTDKRVYAEFFESPFRMERRMCSFKGCFAVNITAYLGDTESERLEELASYFESNPDAKYVMYAIVDNLSIGRPLIRKMEELTGCRKLCFKASEHSQNQDNRQHKQTKEYGY